MTKKQSSNLKIALTAGGTGGHLFPAKSLAEHLKKLGHEVFLVTDQRGLDFEANVPTYKVTSASPTPNWKLPLSLIKLGIGALQSMVLLMRKRPDVVVGFGGYASAPIMAAAAVLKRPSLLHEQNAVMGRVNRLFAPYVKAIASGFPSLRGIREVYKAKTTHTGNPIRPEFLTASEQNYEISEDPTAPINLLVVGGSRGAQVFSMIVPEAIELLNPDLRSRLRITQQARKETLSEVVGKYQSMGVQATVEPFVSNVAQHLANAHLVIGRSGASTVAELACVGRPAILVPYPYATENHQAYNAEIFEALGGGWVMPQEGFTAKSLSLQLELRLGVLSGLYEAAKCAKTLARDDATEKLAKLTLDVATSEQWIDNHTNQSKTERL